MNAMDMPCGKYVPAHKKMLSSRRSRRAYLAFSDALDIVIGAMKEKSGRLYLNLSDSGWVTLSFDGPLADYDYGRFLETHTMSPFLDNVWTLSGRIRRPGCLYYVTHLAQRDFQSVRKVPQDGPGLSILLSYRIDSAMGSYSMRHVIDILRSYRLDYPEIIFLLAKQSGHNHADVILPNG